MAPGRPERISHEYRRNGTVDLFAAFRVKDGRAIGMVAPRHTAAEFLLFLKMVHGRWGRGRRSLHIIVDNFGTHDVEDVREWLAGHRRVHFHFTPTHASWLNQVELWLCIIERQSLKRESFESKESLAEKIMGFIAEYNRTAKSFRWTYEGSPLTI